MNNKNNGMGIQILNLKRELDMEMIGQNKYKKAVVEAIHKMECGIRTHILVVGPTGCGKTYLVDLLKKSKELSKHKYTVSYVNVSRLTEEGYKGKDIEEIEKTYDRDCIQQANFDCYGIVYLDEVDKILESPDGIRTSNNEGNENGRKLQHQLMSLIETNDRFKNAIFILSGAFYQLEDLDIGEVHKSMGFIKETAEKDSILKTEDSIREKLIEIGFQKEFLGRISQVVVMDALNHDELKAILLHPKKGIISQYKKSMSLDGIKLTIEDSAVEKMIECIQKENLGARSVKNTLDSLLSGVWYDCIAGGYNEIVIDESVINGEKVKLLKSGKDSERDIEKKETLRTQAQSKE